MPENTLRDISKTRPLGVARLLPLASPHLSWMSGDVRVNMEGGSPSIINEDMNESDSASPSIDAMLKDKGLDDPATISSLMSLNIVTAADLRAIRIEDMLKAGLTRIQARKLEHIATVVCSHHMGGVQEIAAICGVEENRRKKTLGPRAGSIGPPSVGFPPNVSNSITQSSTNTIKSTRVVGTSLDRPDAIPSESEGFKMFEQKKSSNRAMKNNIDETGSTITSLSAVQDELKGLKSKSSRSNMMDQGGVPTDDSTESSSTLLLVKARKLADVNKLGEATALCERAVEILTKPDRGEDQIESMGAIGFLAELYLHRRRLDNACSHAEWLLTIKKRKMGDEDLSTADTMFLLGEIQKRQGLIAEAAGHLRLCLRVRESVLGEDHIKTAMALHALGNCFLRQALMIPEKLFDARTVLIRGLKVKLKHYGMDHVETARSLDNIAAAMHVQGRYQTAIDVYTLSLECKIRTIGYDNALAADSLFGMGIVARDHQLHNTALELLKSAMELYAKFIGDSHPITRCVAEEVTHLMHQLKLETNQDSQENDFLAKPMAGARNRRLSHGVASHASFKVKKNIQDKSPEDIGKPSRIEEVSPKSKVSTRAKSSLISFPTQSNSLGLNSDRVKYEGSVKLESFDQPRSTAPPVRRRPETARSSWDMEEDYNSTDILNDVQIGENPEGDIMKFLMDQEEDQEAQVKLTSHSTELFIPTIQQVLKKAVGRRNIHNKSQVRHHHGIAYCSEVLMNKVGRAVAIVAGGFEESYSF